ncbi:hypothetical protein XENTR_v10020784 [Xenopus tropicalis]|nr:hypothetical protein XENTR_v10020784 [Xenopus tropicalis]
MEEIRQEPSGESRTEEHSCWKISTLETIRILQNYLQKMMLYNAILRCLLAREFHSLSLYTGPTFKTL